MPVRPSFQFYVGDWRSNGKLRRCSESARGAWIDILCLFHDADEYGLVRWPLADVANAAGVSLNSARELVEKEVLKGADDCSHSYSFRPFHAGKHGDPVTLIDSAEGPVWYSSRMVRDEWIRRRRGEQTRFSSENQPSTRTPKPPFGGTIGVTIGERQGDGPSSSSSSSSSLPLLRKGTDGAGVGEAQDAGKPEWWPKRDRYGRVQGEINDKLIFDIGKAVLGKSSGGQVARLLKLHPYRSDRRAASELLLRADDAGDPKSWFAAALRNAERDEPEMAMHEKFPEREYRV